MPTVMLDQAIVTLFGTIYNAPTLWLGEIPATQASYPRALLRLGDERPLDPLEYNEDDGLPVESVAEFEITVITANADTCRDLLMSVLTTFKPAALALSMDSRLRMLRTRLRPPMPLEQRGPNDTAIFQALVGYRATFGTTY